MRAIPHTTISSIISCFKVKAASLTVAPVVITSSTRAMRFGGCLKCVECRLEQPGDSRSDKEVLSWPKYRGVTGRAGRGQGEARALAAGSTVERGGARHANERQLAEGAEVPARNTESTPSELPGGEIPANQRRQHKMVLFKSKQKTEALGGENARWSANMHLK